MKKFGLLKEEVEYHHTEIFSCTVLYLFDTEEEAMSCVSSLYICIFLVFLGSSRMVEEREGISKMLGKSGGIVALSTCMGWVPEQQGDKVVSMQVGSQWAY